MANTERLQMETKGTSLTIDEFVDIYLVENKLSANDNYDPTSNTNKRNILTTPLSILESVANDLTIL